MSACPVRAAAARAPEGEALVFRERRFTWGDADRLVAAWAEWLEGRGVGVGARVACLSWNRPEVAWLWFALGRLGASLVPLNARLTAAELEPLLARSGARLVLVSEELSERLNGEPFPVLQGHSAMFSQERLDARSHEQREGVAHSSLDEVRPIDPQLVRTGHHATLRSEPHHEGVGRPVEPSEPQRERVAVPAARDAMSPRDPQREPVAVPVARDTMGQSEPQRERVAVPARDAMGPLDPPRVRVALTAASAPRDTPDPKSLGASEQGDLDPQRELAALFTSGTTGAPSLVPLTRANFDASARASAANLGARSGQTWLGSLPLFHVGGLALLHRCAVMGARVWLEAGFDADRVSALLRSGEITHASLVPTALARVLDLDDATFSSRVEAVLIGGGPMGPALLRRARAAGLPVLQTYGLTEACSQVTTERLDDADGTTAGPPVPGVEVEVRAEDGRPVLPGEIGLIWVRGPTVTPSAQGWLETRDLGSLDERGRLTVAARRVDLIISGGENVYPAEVEAVLLESGLVRDAAVGPSADPTWGQVPVAYVVWKGAPNDDALLQFARARLASFKVPKRVEGRAELPRNASGKLLRHRLA